MNSFFDFRVWYVFQCSIGTTNFLTIWDENLFLKENPIIQEKVLLDIWNLLPHTSVYVSLSSSHKDHMLLPLCLLLQQCDSFCPVEYMYQWDVLFLGPRQFRAFVSFLSSLSFSGPVCKQKRWWNTRRWSTGLITTEHTSLSPSSRAVDRSWRNRCTEPRRSGQCLLQLKSTLVKTKLKDSVGSETTREILKVFCININ